MKYSRWISVVVLLCTVLPALAEVGDLKPVSVTPREDLLQLPLRAYDSKNFHKPTEGDGTVNKKARVVTLKSDELTIKAAIDSKDPAAKRPNVIRLDFTGKGKFDDKFVVPMTARSSNYFTIGPKDLMVKVGEETIPVQVKGMYQKSNHWRYIQIYLGTALEGECAFGEKVLPVMIVDATGNLRCADPKTTKKMHGRSFPRGDQVYVGKSIRTQKDTRKLNGAFYGQPVQVDGKWYELKVSEDRKISATPVEVEVAKAQIPNEGWNVVLMGERFTLNLTGGTEPFEIPVDTYRVFHYQQQNKKAMVMLRMSGKEKPFTIKPGELNVLKIGPPLLAKLQPRVQGNRQVYLSLVLTDGVGTNVAYVTNAKGKRPAAPAFEILDESGKKVHDGRMRYG